MPEQRKLEKWRIFCKSSKRYYTDQLLANLIAGNRVIPRPFRHGGDMGGQVQGDS